MILKQQLDDCAGEDADSGVHYVMKFNKIKQTLIKIHFETSSSFYKLTELIRKCFRSEGINNNFKKEPNCTSSGLED